MPENYKSRLYQTLKADNYELPNEQDFYKQLESQDYRKRLYETMASDNYEMKPFNEFENEVGGFQKEDKPKTSYMNLAINNMGGLTSPGTKPFITGTAKELNPWENAKELTKSFINTNIGSLESMLKNSYGAAMPGSTQALNFQKATEKVSQQDVQKAWDEEGLWRQKFINKIIPVDPEVEGSFAGKMSSGAGSMLGFMGWGFLSGAAGAPEAVASGLVGAFSESRDMELSAYDESLKKGLSENEAVLNSQIAGLAGLPIGATEAFPLERMFGAAKDIKLLKGLIPAESKFAGVLSKGIGKVVKNPNVATAIGNATVSFLEEGTQEGIQTMFEDLTANQLYDAQKDILNDMGESALIGGLLGFGMSSITQTATKRLEDKKYTSEAEKEKLRSTVGLQIQALKNVMEPIEEKAKRFTDTYNNFTEEVKKGTPLVDALNVLSTDDEVKDAVISSVQYTPEFQAKQKAIEEEVLSEGLRGNDAVQEIAKRTEEELKNHLSDVEKFADFYGLNNFFQTVKEETKKKETRTHEDVKEELPEEEKKSVGPTVAVSDAVRDIRGELLSPEDNVETKADDGLDEYYDNQAESVPEDVQYRRDINNVPETQYKPYREILGLNPTQSTTTDNNGSQGAVNENLNVWHGTGENANLSNLAERPFTDKTGRKYLSVEHAYQSLKSGKFDEETYNKYKKAGQKIQGNKGTKTEGNWNINLMKQIVKTSFEQNPEAAKELLATGNRTITHTQDKGIWNKEFPKILMEVRSELQQKENSIVPTTTLKEYLKGFFNSNATEEEWDRHIRDFDKLSKEDKAWLTKVSKRENDPIRHGDDFSTEDAKRIAYHIATKGRSLDADVKSEFESSEERKKAQKEYDDFYNRNKEYAKTLTREKNSDEMNRLVNEQMRLAQNVNNIKYDIEQSLLGKHGIDWEGKYNYQTTLQNTSKTSLEAPQASDSGSEGISMPEVPSELTKALKEKNLVPDDISQVMGWMGGNLKNTKVMFVTNNTKIMGTTESFGSAKVKGAYRPGKNGTMGVIAINLDAISKDPMDVARTLAHEMGHAMIYEALRNEKSLHFQKMRDELTSLYNDIYSRLTEADLERYNADKAELDMVFNAMEGGKLDEFVSAMLSKEGALYKYTMSTKADAKTTFMQKFIGIIKKYLARLMGRDMTFYDQFEFIMNSFMEIPTALNMNNLMAEVLPEGYKQENPFIQNDSYNPEDLDSPNVVASVANMLARSEGRVVEDSYEYMQSIPFETLKARLNANTEWTEGVKLHFALFYNRKFKTEEEYKDSLQRRLYNSVMSLSYHPTVRMEFEVQKDPVTNRKMMKLSKISELEKDYLDKDGVRRSGYRPKTRLEELLPTLNKMFDSDMELVYLDQVKVDTGQKKIWKELNAKDNTLGSNRNQFYVKTMLENGYVYLGTWSDKSTVVALKVGEKGFSQDMIVSLQEMYAEKSDEMMQSMNDVPEDKKNLYLSFDHALRQNPEIMPAYIMRGVLEDLRLGGKFNEDTGELESSLYSKKTYDAISIFKRAYLISPKAYVHQDPKEVQKLIEVPEGGVKHGMSLDANGKLQMRSFIFDAEGKGVTIPVTFRGKTFDMPLEKLLVNNYGTPTTDGAVYYVGGGFDRIYRKLHGATKKGAIKAWISNDFEGSFSNPLYVKSAYHRIDPKSPVGVWMQNNGITFLMSSKSVKVNDGSYPVNNESMSGMINDIDKKTFQIPFEAMQRDKEKDEAKNGARGIMQSLSSNLTTRNNPGFIDHGWNPAIEIMTNNLVKNFRKKMESLSPAGILDYMKEKALHAETEQERAIANIMIDLAYTNIDPEYAKVKSEYEALMDEEVRDEEKIKEKKKELRSLKMKEVVISEDMAPKIARLFHEPYFAKGLKNYVKDEMEKVTNLRVPATWAVYRPDTGYFEPHIVEAVWNQIEKSYKEETDLKVKSLNEYIETINKQYDFNEALGKKKEESLRKYKERIQNELKSYGEGTRADATREEIAKVEAEIKALNDNLSRISDEDIKEIEKTEAEIEELSKEMNSNFHQAEIKRRFEEMIDPETGRIKENHAIISQDIADAYNLKHGDEIITNCVPSDGIMALQGVKIAAILPESMADRGTIMLNSEHTQTRVGKDFDIDTIYIMPYSEYFNSGNTENPREHYDNMIKTIRESTKEHVKKITSTYRSKLYNVPVTIGNNPAVMGRDLSEADVFSQEAGLAFMQNTGATPKDGQTLFNPVFQSMSLLNKYYKDVAGVISRRKLLTMKSAVDFNKIADHNMWTTYLQLMRMTNDNVDMPTNTNNMFYEVTKVKAYDFDHATDYSERLKKLYDEMDQVTSQEMTEEKKKEAISAVQNKINSILYTVDITTDIENFLFKSGAMINSEYNLEEKDAIKDLDALMRQVRKQQDINKLIQSTEGRDKLKEEYIKQSDYFKGKKVPALYGKIADKFFRQITFGNLHGSPLLYIADSIPLNTIPKLGLTEDEYRLIQNSMIDALPVTEGVIKERKKVLENELNKDILLAVEEENKKAVTNFLLTSLRPIHKLKAELIATINPVEQKTFKLGSGNNFYHNIYQEVNENVYPKLFRLLMESKSIEFNRKGGVEEIGLLGGPIKNTQLFLKRTENDDLVLTYKPNEKDRVTFRMSDLLNAKEDTDASRIRQWLTGDAFREARNRFELSKLVLLGGRSVPISERMKMAVDLMNRNVQNYKEFDRILMYMSLVGKMSGKSLPINFTSPGNPLNGFSSQDKFLEFLGKVSDPTAKRFIGVYARTFNNVFDQSGAKGFETIQEVKKMVEEPMTTSPEIFFRLNAEALKETEALEDYKLTALELAKTIYGIMNIDKSVIEDIERTVAYSISFKNENSESVTINDILNEAATRYHTNMTRNVSVTERAFALSKKLSREINARLGDGNLMIQDVENYATHASKNLKLSMKDAYKRINDIVEGNTSLRFIKENGKEYIERKEDGMTFSFDRKGIDEYLRSTQIEKKEYALYRAALEIQRQMSLRNQRTVFAVINHLYNLKRSFQGSFGYMDMIDSLIWKYENLFGQMNGTHGTYIPRVYEKKVFESVILPKIRGYVKKEVIKNIIEEKKRQERKETYLEKYAKMNLPNSKQTKEFNEKALKAIDEEVEKRMSQEVAGMTKDDHGNFVYVFQMKRTLPKSIQNKKLYIRDDLSIFVSHQNELMGMIHGDLNTLDMLKTEHDLRQQGADQKVVNMMRRWYSNTTVHRMFMEEAAKTSDVKEGMGISFYTTRKDKNGVLYSTSSIKGIVKRVDKDYIYLDVDREKYSKILRDKIEKYSKIHDDINSKGFGGKSATGPQIATLKDLQNQGYATLSSGMTISEANEEILKALNFMLNDDMNWGKFRKSELMVKQYEGSNLTFKEGVMKHLDDPSRWNKIRQRIWQDIKMTSSVIYLGTPGGGFKNLQEAQWAMLRDMGMNPFYMKEGWAYAREFNRRKKKGEIRNYEAVLDDLKGISPEDIQDEDELKLAHATADKYVVENDLLGNEIVEQVKAEAGNKKKTTFEKKAFDYINGEPGNVKYPPLKWVSKGTGVLFGVKTFGDFEKLVRRQAAYAYALRAVKFDKVYDPKVIESIINHGVARTQGLYDMMERHLAESTEGGKLLYGFSQYPVFQMNNYKLGIKQAKMLGISLKDSFHPNAKGSDGEIHKWNSSIDPNIAFKNLFELVMDSYAFTAGNLFGLQVGNPVNRLMVMAPAILMHWAMGGFRDDDPWGDLFFFATIVGSFFFGIGFTLIPYAVYNIAVKKYYPPPRLWTFGTRIYDSLFGENETQSQKLRKLNNDIKAITNLDLIPQKSSIYASENENFWRTKTPDEKLKNLILQDEGDRYQYEPGIPLWKRKTFPFLNLMPVASTGSTMK